MQLCESCGDELQLDSVCPDDIAQHKHCLWNLFCDDCAREKAGGGLPPLETLQHGTGGGIRVIRGTRTFGG